MQVWIVSAAQADAAAKADMAKKPCVFAGHAAQALGGADGWLLAGAIAFLLARGFAPVYLPALRRPFRLRPPLRAPPLIA